MPPRIAIRNSHSAGAVGSCGGAERQSGAWHSTQRSKAGSDCNSSARRRWHSAAGSNNASAIRPAVALHNNETLAKAFPDRFFVSPSLERFVASGMTSFYGPDGKLDPRWNVNGAVNAIAGILNDRGNVLGLMPHPENHVESAIGPTDGRGLFAGLAEALERAA